jgi:hypothetical protein
LNDIKDFWNEHVERDLEKGNVRDDFSLRSPRQAEKLADELKSEKWL